MKKENKDQYVLKYRYRDDRLSDLVHYLENSSGDKVYPCKDVLNALGVPTDADDCVKYADVSSFIEDMDNINTINSANSKKSKIAFECMQCGYRAESTTDISSWQFCPHCGSIFAPYYF